MAARKKTAVNPPEPDTVQQAALPAQEGADVQEGIDIQETALGAGEGELAAVDSPVGLNLRAGPGFDFEVLQKLEDATVLAVQELPYGAQVPGWMLVHTGERTGWVSARYLRKLEQAAKAE